VFVEVRTRTREDFGRPFESIDHDKQRRVARGGLAWLRLLDNPDVFFRFDVVEVILMKEEEPKLELIKNAFQLPEPYIY
jgi:putative endonuclease